MSSFTAAPSTTRVRTGTARAARIGLWTVRVLLSAQFVGAGLLKITADPAMVTMFADIGGPSALRLFVGSCELAGALGLLVPQLYRLAALGLVGLMLGAAVTNVVALHTSPLIPIVLMVLASVVVLARPRTAGAR